MNELSVEPTAVVVKPRRAAPVAARSEADWERGVNLFILAAASFLRSAAKEPGRRGIPGASKSRPPRKAPVAARKSRAGHAAKRSSAKQ